MLSLFIAGCTGSSSDSGGSSGSSGKSWTNPSSLTDNISPDGQNAWSPQVAMDNSGDAIVVWYQSDGSNNQIFKAEYRGGVWSLPSSLTDNISPDTRDAVVPQVAMDNNGNAIITWMQRDASNFYQIFKSTYSGGVWTNPSSLSDNISPDGTHAENPMVAMDDNGQAIIVWLQYDGSDERVYKSTFDGTWHNPTDLTDSISPATKDASYAGVAMSNDGTATIVWQESDGSDYQIFRSIYDGSTWTDPSSLTDNISPDGESAEEPQVAMDNNGNAIITWMQYDGSDWRIFKSEYRSGAWTDPSISDGISFSGSDAEYPEVAMDNNGNAIITWLQSDGTNQQVFKSEYRGGVWTSWPSSLTDNISPDGQDAEYPEVAMDNNGNAIITWMQSDGTNQQVFKSEYRSGAWTNPASLTDNISPDGQDVSLPQVAMSNKGTAVITWQQSDATTLQTFMSIYK